MNVNPFSYLIEKLKSKFDKSGGTISGNVTIDRRNGTVDTEGESALLLGNDIAVGTANNSSGAIYLWKGNKYLVMRPDTLNANKSIVIPNNSGTLALTSDIPNSAKVLQFQKLNNTNSATFQIPAIDRGVFMIVNRQGALIISEDSSGGVEQCTVLGNITYTNNGDNSITVSNGAYYRGVSLIQLC